MRPAPGARPVVVLAGEGPSSDIVYHALARRFARVEVIVEEPVARGQLLRGRARKVGWVSVAGQVAFMAAVLPLLRRSAAGRVQAVKAEFGMDDSPIPDGVVTRVSSVNSDRAREALLRLDPGVVVVNGTRIIGKKTLSAVDAPFINMHAGITPLYRGVHGGYWALAEGRPELAGTTVHLVDTGIDTGGVIAQATFKPGPADSFVTYPYLHLAAGIPLLLDAVASALAGTLRVLPHNPELPSRLRYHPSLWEYVAARARRGVR